MIIFQKNLDLSILVELIYHQQQGLSKHSFPSRHKLLGHDAILLVELNHFQHILLQQFLHYCFLIQDHGKDFQGLAYFVLLISLLMYFHLYLSLFHLFEGKNVLVFQHHFINKYQIQFNLTNSLNLDHDTIIMVVKFLYQLITLQRFLHNYFIMMDHGMISNLELLH